MADIFLPQQAYMPTSSPADDWSDPTIPRSSLASGPPPNPPFVFPMQSVGDAGDSSKGIESMSNGTTGSRAKTRSRPQHLSFNALPDFIFHPSPSSDQATELVTSSSPSKSHMVPSHHGGHRRNGSEFIGGDGRNGVTGLMSTSPTKGEGALPPPPGARTGPPASRRGHAHRRSGAISSHDVSNILKPSNELRGGSAPTTPSDPLMQPSLPPVLDRSISQPTTSPPVENAPAVPHHRHVSSTTGQTRPRVGFSDHVEFIPRPLSTVSSETSSSLSTIRPCHSVTGSISSIISSVNASPPTAKSAKVAAVDCVDEEMVFPNQSSIPSFSPKSHQESPVEHSEPILDASVVRLGSETPGTLNTWSEVFSSPRSERGTNRSSLEDDAAAMLRLCGTPETLRNRRRPVSSINSPISRPRTSPEPKVSKRQRKDKSWAGSFLARKARNSLPEDTFDGRGSPAPRISSISPADLSFENLNFDEDTTCVIDTAPQVAKASPLGVDFATSSATESSPKSDADDFEEVFDLDAAYGPGPSFEPWRRLHSSGVTGGFDGPGMHYHRRAESAPELAPVNRHIFNSARPGNNASIDRVVEEDEEDEIVTQVKSPASQKSGKCSEGRSLRASGSDVGIGDLGKSTGSSFSKGQLPLATSGTRNDSAVVGSCSSTTSPADFDTFRAIEIVSADEEPREPMATKSKIEPTVTPALASDPFINRPVSAPMQYMFPTTSPVFANPEIYSSAASTPDFSQISFEPPRLHTATSSITDRATLSSFRAGDQGLDYRISVDDVPSLTSSASTMTNAYPPRVSSSVHTRTSADRPPSLSVAVAPRTRPENASKRSSLASLSRLVGGSHGEKSKLNIEEHAQPEDTEKIAKKRGKRISRLMRFWKSKEKVAP
ncbi:MAG: hypothetical protein Q9170_003859 [Blastenia crenularia]